MKKMLSGITAMTLAVAGLSAFSTSAIARPFDESLTGEFEGFELLYSFKSYGGDQDYFIYMKKKGEFTEFARSYNFIEVNYIPNQLKLEFTIDKDNDAIVDKVKDLIKSYGGSTPYYNKNGISYQTMLFKDGSDGLRNFYSELSEYADIQEFTFYEQYGISSGNGYLMMNTPTYYQLNEEEIDKLADYIEEKELDFSMIKSEKSINNRPENPEYSVVLEPNYDIDPDDHIQVAVDIKNALGYPMYIVFQTSASAVGSSSCIDVLNSVDGDANCDGQLTIADAAAVIQSLGNADKYGLSAQGRFNTDLSGDGITTADAVEIQKMCIEKS